MARTAQSLASNPVTRRHFLFGAAIAAITGGASAAYARFGEPEWLEVTHHRISATRGGGEPLRILHLSDLHASEVVPLELIARAIRLGIEQRPQLALLTGDYVTGRYDAWGDYREVLRVLTKAVPTFGCLGNHDGGDAADRVRSPEVESDVQRGLRTAGVELLHNRAVDITIAARQARITGVGDLWSGECNPGRAFDAPVPDPSAMHLVLNHNPDARPLFAGLTWDLMLCGHTHGGQLRIPFLGTPFAPVRDKRYVEGWHRWNGGQVFITRGVGNLHGVRFNCRPEVSILDVT